MMAFFGWVMHYLIELVAMVILAGLGLTLGIKLRKNKNAKEATLQTSNTIDEK